MSTRYKNIGRTKYQSRFQDRIIWIMAKLFLRDIHARKRNFIGRVVKLPIRLTLRREKGDEGEKCIKVFPIPTTQEPRDDSHYLENSFHPFIARVAELFFTRFRVRAPSHERYKRPNLAASRASHSEINRNENSNGTIPFHFAFSRRVDGRCTLILPSKKGNANFRSISTNRFFSSFISPSIFRFSRYLSR